MKKEYQKPISEILEIEPLQMICTSPDPDEPKPENEDWFDMPDESTGSKFTGVLD